MNTSNKIFIFIAFFLYISLSTASTEPDYVGDQPCKSCHLKEHQQWQGSHHDLAMQEANDKTVLGYFNKSPQPINSPAVVLQKSSPENKIVGEFMFDKSSRPINSPAVVLQKYSPENKTVGVFMFDKSSFKKDNITSTFFKKNGHFMVNTEGADGQLYDYEISYTFGVYPLQQYMVKFPQGKIQVLDIAWDSRTKEEGGQRWFSLNPDESITAGDVLHWTGPNLNWNYMCADCHSTNLKKNYSDKTKSYTTQWDAINVSCEACHGPASQHLKWAHRSKEKASTENNNPQSHQPLKGLTIDFSPATCHQWKINDKSKKPECLDKLTDKADKTEIELCAKCHSRRSQIDDNFIPGDNFRDHYRPALLTEALYYPDGKIKDEVYVYGSFTQSRMYHAGVTCSDCHNTHTLALKADGDKVCQQCHLSTNYATAEHHFHKADSTGTSCIACHMPAKTYMGVDVRHDHSFRIPRPDLAEQLNIPDACSNCHKALDKPLLNSQDLADAIIKWTGKTPQGYQKFGPALNALEQQKENALSLAYDLLLNESPGIAKATVISYLGEYPSRKTFMTAMQMLRSKDADVRSQALYALQSFPIQYTVEQIFSKLNDPVKIVRLEAARILAAVPQGLMAKEQSDLINKVIEEYRQSLLFNAERPEAQLSLAQLYGQLGQIDKAEAAFKEALILQPGYIPAYINYANFLQQQKKESAAYDVLKKGLQEVENASLYHALGLWTIRNKSSNKTKKEEDGLSLLQKAAELEPDNARYQYVYAVAVAEKQPEQAIQILLASLQNHSGNLEIMSALVSYYKQLGDAENSNKYRQKVDSMLRYKVQ